MIKFFRNALKPAAYHGQGRKLPFFEGWYFKLIDAKEQHTAAVIPGIFLAEDPENTCAFVQVLDSAANRLTFHRYPAEAFTSHERIFDIRIGANRFSKKNIILNIDDDKAKVRGELKFTASIPWPVTLVSPGIMGWYAWMPFMECYHGVVSLDHIIEGSLEIDNRRIEFNGGHGYTEKDWGCSFPSAWIWTQCNHFSTPGSSFTASVAIIPWIGRSFPGFIIGLWHNGKLYRFATYTGAKIRELSVSEDAIRWVAADRKHTLEIRITRPKTKPVLLHVPSLNGMDRCIEERLNATLQLRLFAKKKVLFEENSSHAGLEVVGEVERMVAMWKEKER